MTVKIDQIADAIISAPGVRIEISDGQPVNTIAISTNTKIMPEDEAYMSFNVPVAGIYKIQFGFQFLNQSSATAIHTGRLLPIGNGNHTR